MCPLRPVLLVTALVTLLAAGVAPAAAALEAAAPPAAAVSQDRPAPVMAAAALVKEVEHEERSFLEDHLPASLQRHGPRGLRWWQWLALPIAALLALAIGWLVGWLSRRLLLRLTAPGPGTRELMARLRPPVTVFWSLVAASALRPVLALDAASDQVLERWLGAGFVLVVFWGAYRAIDGAFRVLGEAPAARSNAGLQGLLPLLRKIAKVVALALGVVAVLSQLGFQVTSLLAGLGIGGLALALAAQKTVENLIGSLAIGVDQPFRVGDFVQVEGTSGTVETVGMRSTRIRTLDRTLVTIPNGKLADLRIESLAARDRFRLLVTLRLRYGTSPEQLRRVLREVEATLAAHPARGPETPQVRLMELGESALVVEVMAWLTSAGWNEFLGQREALLLRFMEIVEGAGVSFAFPTRTVRLEPTAPAPGGAPPR
jgi:MscS family membrane protein